MTIAKFSELNLVEPLLRALNDNGYIEPTPIQKSAIPALLLHQDLIGCAQTGTGKTAAFALPILQDLYQKKATYEKRQCRVLVLAPTRELAIQIFDSFKEYGKYLNFRYAIVFGGVGQNPQVKSLAHGVDVLVATPGRLLDLINQKFVNLHGVETFVLDEADRMLDMGFIRDIQKIIAILPKERHTLFFSATMAPEIEKLASTLLRNPTRVMVAPPASTVELVQQSVMFVERNMKKNLLKHILQDANLNKVIVFTRTKHGANHVSEILMKAGIGSAAIHGNKSQGARQRALEDFRSGKMRVLVATDIAARGIDIDNISHVINFELPNIAESYVHRIGRTARAGAQGVAISFCDSEERAYLKDIEKLTRQIIRAVIDQPYHSENVLSGPVLKKGKAKALIEQQFKKHSRAKHTHRQNGNGKKSSLRETKATHSNSYNHKSSNHKVNNSSIQW